MARKKRAGFKAPKHYEPRRGKGGKAKLSRAGTGATNRRGAGARTGAGSRAQHSAARVHSRQHGADQSVDRTQRADGSKARTQRRPQHELKRFEKLQATIASANAGSGMKFSDLGLGPRLTAKLAELGAVEPFAIQAVTIPDIVAGRDVLGRAMTGSGKTIAFGAALVERLVTMKLEGKFAHDPKPQKPQRLERGKRAPDSGRTRVRVRNPKALILAPTRELALQIDETVQQLARTVGLYTAQLVGGVPAAGQQHALRRGVDIVIGTPGRVEDLIARGDLRLAEVEIAVLDEADHMSELGFIEPVQRILRQVKNGAQQLMFSATLDGEVAQVAHEFMRTPAVHEVAGVRKGEIFHHVMMVSRDDKDEVLVSLMRPNTLVFTRTRLAAERLTEVFEAAGVNAIELHGDLSQHRREKNLERFARGRADVLVATDVAARGLHVDNIALVVQADPPDSYKAYLHRSGRTGRAGDSGVVVTLIPRSRQQKMRAMLAEADVTPATFAEFAPGDRPPFASVVPHRPI